MASPLLGKARGRREQSHGVGSRRVGVSGGWRASPASSSVGAWAKREHGRRNGISYRRIPYKGLRGGKFERDKFSTLLSGPALKRDRAPHFVRGIRLRGRDDFGVGGSGADRHHLCGQSRHRRPAAQPAGAHAPRRSQRHAQRAHHDQEHRPGPDPLCRPVVAHRGAQLGAGDRRVHLRPQAAHRQHGGERHHRPVALRGRQGEP